MRGGMEKNQSTENKHTPPPFTPPVLSAIQTLIGEPGSILTEHLEGKVHCFDIGLLQPFEVPWTNAHGLKYGTGLAYNLTFGSIVDLGLFDIVILEPMTPVPVTIAAPALIPVTDVTMSIVGHQI